MTPDRLYRFVQFEYPWPLGPTDGRYLIRDHAGEEAHHVLVLAGWETTTARRARKWGREPEPRRVPAETGLSRATLVDTTVVGDEEARAWLRTAGPEVVDEALGWVNFTLRAHRAATADPTVREVGTRQALAIRAGYGAGFEVADGNWTEAREVPADTRERGSRRAKRDAALQPQERLAALLSGRDVVLACEEMALRARSDLDSDRPREAALQVHLALEAAIAELQAFRSTHSVGTRLDDLEARRDRLAAAANEALQGGPSQETVEAVTEGLERIEAILRARTASSTY